LSKEAVNNAIRQFITISDLIVTGRYYVLCPTKITFPASHQMTPASYKK